MDLSELFANPDLLQSALTALALLLVIIVAVVAAAFGVRITRAQLRIAGGVSRDIIPYVDEPTDAAIVLLTRYLPTVAPMVVQYAPVWLRALAEAFEKVGQEPPPAEVNIGGEAK